jgi:hypothetical protein
LRHQCLNTASSQQAIVVGDKNDLFEWNDTGHSLALGHIGCCLRKYFHALSTTYAVWQPKHNCNIRFTTMIKRVSLIRN